MNIIPRLVVTNAKNELDIVDVELDNFKLNTTAVMAIDGSTTCTGVAFLEKEHGYLLGTMALKRSNGESQVRYKVEYKKLIADLLRKFKITNIFYEEPYIGFAESTKALFLLRSSIEELIIENEPEFDYIKYIEVNNKRWKKSLLGEGNCPVGTDLEKAAVKAEIVRQLPFMDRVTQDEIDATGIGFVAITRLKSGTEVDLASNKKAKPFKFNIKFIGADDDDEFYTEFFDQLEDYKIPTSVLDNGMTMTKIPGSGIFDNYAFKYMGDSDKLLVLCFSVKHHANIILEHRISNLTANNKYIYAIIWRKTRKN